MTHLDFLSPDLAGADAVWHSPLERALAHAPEGIEDLSRTGVLEVRGELDDLDAGAGEVVRLTPERALVLCPFEEADGRCARVWRAQAGWSSTSRPAGQASRSRVRPCFAA